MAQKKAEPDSAWHFSIHCDKQQRELKISSNDNAAVANVISF